MDPTTILIVIAGLAFFGYVAGRQRAILIGARMPSSRADKPYTDKLHSLPGYYGAYLALWCLLPLILIFALWLSLEPVFLKAHVLSSLPPELVEASADELGLTYNNIRNLVAGNIVAGEPDVATLAAVDVYRESQAFSRKVLIALLSVFAVVCFIFAWRRIAPAFRARNRVEKTIEYLLVAASLVAILTTIGIFVSVLFESIRFFQEVPFLDFLFGFEWSPQTAIREDQVGSSGTFGAIPLFAGTLLISGLAMLVAAPVGLMAAIYLSEYASRRVRGYAKPLLEILAGIPTVVYGYFAALTVGPILRAAGESFGFSVSSESALGAGLVMGIMIIPFVSSLSDDVINAVPQALRDGSYGLGATQSETIRQVILPAALPGIVGAILLAVSRAIGETMIVVMAAGLSANLTANPLEAVTTVTVQIVTLLVGDQEFDSPKTLAAFALGLVLFVVTLILNVIALSVVRRYREQYE